VDRHESRLLKPELWLALGGTVPASHSGAQLKVRRAAAEQRGPRGSVLLTVGKSVDGPFRIPDEDGKRAGLCRSGAILKEGAMSRLDLESLHS